MSVWVQAALAAWCLGLAAFMGWAGKSRYVVLAPLCLGLSIFAFNLYNLAPKGDLKFAYELQALGLNSVVFLYVSVVTYVLCNPPREINPTACILWGTVAVLEGYAVLIERFGCAILGDQMSWELLEGTWGLTVAASACGRVVSEAFVWLPLTVGVGFMTLMCGLSIRWSHIWKS